MDAGPPENGEPSNSAATHEQLTRLQKISNAVHAGIARAFRRWAAFVSSKPYTIIVVSTIFAAAWTVAFFLLFTQELDNDDLFTPEDAKAFDAKRYVDATYGSYRARSRVISIRHPDFITEEGCRGRLLLTNETTARESIQEFYRVYEDIRTWEVIYEGELYTLDDVCIKPANNSPCLVTSILDLWEYDPDVINAPDFNPLKKINADEELFDRFGVPLDVNYYLGKSNRELCDPGTQRSSNVEALAMSLNYIYERKEVDGAEIDPESQEWVEGIADRLREISKHGILDSYVADPYAVTEASNEQLRDDLSLLAIGYILIIAYTHVVLFKNNCHSCKMHLSIVSVISIFFALMSAFGMAQTFGIKFNMVVQVLPFLILGLGIDDTFVIVGAYQKLPFDLPVPEKIAQTLEAAGSSILVTSATDFCAFLVGVYTRLPALRAFAAYAAMAIFFDFIFQVTFFVAFLVLDARREARYRNGSPLCGVKLRCGASKYDETQIQESAPECQEMQQPAPECAGTSKKMEAVKNATVWRKMCGSGDYNPEIPSLSTKIAGTYLPAVTLSPVGRIAVLFVECVLLGFAIDGCTKVKMDFNFIDMFTPDGSPLKTAFNLEEKYYYGDQVLFQVYTKEAAGGDYFYHQDELEKLKTALEDDKFVVSPVHTWYEGYSSWLRDESVHADELVNGRAPDPASFNRWLMEYLDGPGFVHKESLIFSTGSNPHVISSWIGATTVDVVDGPTCVRMVDSIRNSIETAAPSLDPVAFALDFLFFDGYRVIAWETIRNVSLAAIGVFIMSLVVLASLPMALMVVSMVALTDVMLFGYMWYVDQYFNPVTAIKIVLAVGIAVDYSAHIAHSFLVVPGDRLSRARGALEHIGGEVMSGAFTTWLGIVLMFAAGHYAFQSFFKMFCAIIVAGAWHGLIVLPVLLSFAGPKPYPSGRIEDASGITQGSIQPISP